MPTAVHVRRAGALGSTLLLALTGTLAAAATASAAGGRYVSLGDSYGIEGLVPTSPAAPFHPNALGEAAMARALEGAID